MSRPFEVLIIDDDGKILSMLSDILSEEGFIPLTASTSAEALKLFSLRNPRAVILDLVFDREDVDGIDLLKRMKEESPDVPIIMLSGHGTIERAVESIKLGAYDFLEKPVSYEKVLVTLRNAIAKSSLEEERKTLLREIMDRYQIIGVSAAIKGIFKKIEKFADVDSPVLITGESGTGKELIARAIHLKSRRVPKPFIAVNCSAIPDELIESEMFGYEKGAFTGAVKSKPGMFELAAGGTLFLDEISEMSRRFQAKLLRAVETLEVQRVGGTRKRKVDIRIISASNKNLKKEVEKGNFREDLYYRLGVLTIEVPPLRERKEDIPSLVLFYIRKFCEERKIPVKNLHPEALGLLIDYPWPGNVRELKNLVEKIVVLSDGEEITPDDVKEFLEESEVYTTENDSLESVKAKAEREKILKELEAHNWNYSRTASALRISRATLFNKMKKYNISRRSKPLD